MAACDINVDKLLKNQWMPERVLPNSYANSQLRNVGGSTPTERYFCDNLNVPSRVQNMIGNLHQYMKATAPPHRSVPSVPAAIAEIPAPPLPTAPRRIKAGNVTTLARKPLPLSRIKARMSQHAQSFIRSGYGDLSPKNFSNQRRIREVLMQKNLLQGMLMQHKKLRLERQTIELDLNRMRQDLDKIKSKLDTSLQTLKSTHTMYSGINRNKRRLSLPANTKVAKQISRSPQVKPNNILSKRQHGARPKRLGSKNRK